jgi:DNA-binding HxlR family transcriptional regulator
VFDLECIHDVFTVFRPAIFVSIISIRSIRIFLWPSSILIISIIGHHEKIRFNDIMQRLDGISPKTLTDVLKDLKKENLIHRESFAEIPPRVEYSLTEDGKQLCEAVLPLIQWAEKRDTSDTHRCRGNCHEEGVVPKKVGKAGRC